MLDGRSPPAGDVPPARTLGGRARRLHRGAGRLAGPGRDKRHRPVLGAVRAPIDFLRAAEVEAGLPRIADRPPAVIHFDVYQLLELTLITSH